MFFVRVLINFCEAAVGVDGIEVCLCIIRLTTGIYGI